MATILLVEDNRGISEGLKLLFDSAGHKLLMAENIKEATELIGQTGISLILLDVSLPDGNGFDFYKQVVVPKALATIFLTARDEEDDIIRGLELGAEDYITKPFSAKELVARTNRALARTVSVNKIAVADVSYDLDRMELSRGGEIVRFSSLELKILHLLMENHDRVVSRNAIIDCIWEATGNDVYEHTVTVYVKRIREKIGIDIIKTIKGVGYRIDTEG
ncbi:MAG: response regulator transcription factor [Agathobacter sp.]|nr:response regulator transcription factor [Agathobacter sp.]